MCSNGESSYITWVLACHLILACMPLGLPLTTSPHTGVDNLAVVGLQHRDFDEELLPNLSFGERVELAVRRSHARKARIEGLLSKAWEREHHGRQGVSTARMEVQSTSSKEIFGRSVRQRASSHARARTQNPAIRGRGFKSAYPHARGTGEGLASRRNSSRGYAAEVEAGDSAFIASIYIGTPPSRMRAILDTGSDLVWQQCAPCFSCYRQPDLPVFDPALSSSFRRATCAHPLCQQLLQYSSSSSSPCNLGSPNLTCQFTYTYGDNSVTSGALAFDTLTLLDSRGQVTSILTNRLMPAFYYLDLIGISVDDVRLDIPERTFSLTANGSGGMIIDSGTTMTYFQEHGYRVVLRAIQSRLSGQIQLPRSMSGMDLCFVLLNHGILPNLTLHFDGANMELPSSNLFVPAGVEGVYCLALSSSRDLSILGNIQQQNYQFLFDRNRKTLSFLPSTCAAVAA